MKEFQYTVKDACGIHARPAGLLVKVAKGFASTATLEKDGKTCDLRKLMALMGMGADIWGEGTLKAGLLFAALIIPVFIYRHFIQDKGVFPATMLDDMHLSADEEGVSNRAGILPYLTLAAGVGIVWFFHHLATSGS